jgi:type II secretory pathway pseudopilin PulG
MLPVGLLITAVSMADSAAAEPTLMIAFGVVYFGFGLLALFAGIGMWGLRGYGRTLQIVSSSIGLLAIPFGTIISGIILWYMLKPGVKVLFSERPVAQLTPFEIEEVTKLQQGSAAVIVLAVVLPLVIIVGIGIIAAIAIPSLLRARISANEAQAIGDLRTMISAQAAYANANGGLFDTPQCLAAPTDCLPGYPATGPVFLDEASVDVVKSGYQREFHPGSPADGENLSQGNVSPSSLTSFAFVAHPVTPGTSGVRAFCADATGRVCVTPDGSPPPVLDGACDPSCIPLQ